jgi:hypothetical protein
MQTEAVNRAQFDWYEMACNAPKERRRAGVCGKFCVVNSMNEGDAAVPLPLLNRERLLAQIGSGNC